MHTSNQVYKVDKDGNKTLVKNKKELDKYINRISGENNTIVIPDDVADIQINYFAGNNNIIYLSENSKYKINYIIGDNNTLKLGKTEQTSDITIELKGNDSVLYSGDSDYYFRSVKLKIEGDKKNLIIGKDCMFSYGIEIWTGDGHPIYDITQNKRINQPKDVIIGNHVWIGRNASVHKGAVIPDGCVVGANSFVTHKFEEPNTIIAGTPAKVIRRNIRWEC